MHRSIPRPSPFWGILFAVALLVSACGRLEGGAAPEEAEEKTAQVTVWGDRFEIFLEHRLLVVGVPTKFITHVTDLVTLEPRREGPVTFVLRHGAEAPTEHVAPAPARDGIYLPELTFPKAGEWLVSLHIPFAGETSVVSLPPLTVFASHAEAKNAPEPAAPDGISFLKEQQWKILTQTEPAAQRPLIERLRLAGVVAVRPGHSAAVTPPIAGHLVPPPGASMPSLGTPVKAGQVLAMIQPHLAGTELLTLVSTQQQILALELELTVKAAEADAEVIRARVAFTQAAAGRPSFIGCPVIVSLVPGAKSLRRTCIIISVVGPSASKPHVTTLPSPTVTSTSSQECGLVSWNSFTTPSTVTVFLSSNMAAE